MFPLVLLFTCGERALVMGGSVSLCGDNEAAVEGVRRYRGHNESRSGALTRLLGVLEVPSGWHFDAKHGRGYLKVAADGISR